MRGGAGNDFDGTCSVTLAVPETAPFIVPTDFGQNNRSKVQLLLKVVLMEWPTVLTVWQVH